MHQGWSRARAQLVQGAAGWMFVFKSCCLWWSPRGKRGREGEVDGAWVRRVCAQVRLPSRPTTQILVYIITVFSIKSSALNSKHRLVLVGGEEFA